MGFDTIIFLTSHLFSLFSTLLFSFSCPLFLPLSLHHQTLYVVAAYISTIPSSNSFTPLPRACGSFSVCKHTKLSTYLTSSTQPVFLSAFSHSSIIIIISVIVSLYLTFISTAFFYLSVLHLYICAHVSLFTICSLLVSHFWSLSLLSILIFVFLPLSITLPNLPLLSFNQ